jgi:hypothetical protein
MKIFTRVFAAATLLVFFGAITTRANDKHASLPASVLSAKTIYVDNQTNSAELQNTAYTELAKWGRFQIVDTPQKADIVLRLSNGNYVKFVPGDGNPTVYDPKPGKQNWTGADEAVPPGSTRVSLINPKTANQLWFDIRKTSDPKAASHMLDGLREAFDRNQK